MATKIGQGGAPSVAQVTDWTLGGTWEADDRIIFTIGTRSFSMAAGSTTIATIVANMVAAWTGLSATLYPEFAEMTASADGSTDFRLTANAPGRPFTVTITTTEANGAGADSQTIGAATTVIANSGPNDWNTAANWSGGAVPVNGDDVVLENGSWQILYGLDQNAVDLASLTVKQSFSGRIGLPLVNIDGGNELGSGAYYEYRDRYLKIGFTTLTFGQGEGAGCPFANIDGDSTQFTANIYNTGQSEDQNRPALLLRGSHASNVLSVNRGSVGVAWLAGETATIAALNVGYRDNVAGDSTVRLGTGVTLTTVNVRGGIVETNSNATTITITDGELTIGAGTVTTLNLDGGTVYYQSTGTLTTANVGDGGRLDFSRDMRGRTVTTCNVFAGGTVHDPFASVTWTNGIDLERCAIADVTVEVGTHRKITPGVPA